MEDVDAEPITIKVKNQANEELFFKIKKTAKMQKVFEAYANRQGVEVSALRFVLDGERVKPEDTPKMLELSEDDCIDVMLEYVGGGGDEEGSGGEAPITLKVRDQTGDEMFFKVKKGTAMQKIIDAYAQRRGVTAQSLRFMFDNTRITGTDTPKMLEMEDDDQIDVYLEQVGGGADDEDEVKAGAALDAPITIRVKEGSGEEVLFKVKVTTKMKRIFDAYASRRGVAADVLRFFLDGERITEEETPKILEMSEEDQIDVMIYQEGGASDDEDDRKPNALASDDQVINIQVKDGEGNVTTFKVKKSTQFQKVFDAYATRKGVDVKSVRFLYDGQHIQGAHTPKMLELTEGDQIDAVIQQTGGSQH